MVSQDNQEVKRETVEVCHIHNSIIYLHDKLYNTFLTGTQLKGLWFDG